MLEWILLLFSSFLIFLLYEKNKTKIVVSQKTHLRSKKKLNVDDIVKKKEGTSTENHKKILKNANAIKTAEAKTDYLRSIYLSYYGITSHFSGKAKNVSLKSRKGRTKVEKAKNGFRGIDRRTGVKIA